MELPDTGVVIDVSHGNGAAETNGKSATGQKKAFARTLELIKTHGEHIRGVMVEGYINEGNGLGYGLSRTDPCVDITGTQKMIKAIASQVAEKR